MKKVSSEWVKEYNVKILDPDGWDRTNYNYSFNKEKITREEFEHRLIRSTIQGGFRTIHIKKGAKNRGNNGEDPEAVYKQFF